MSCPKKMHKKHRYDRPFHQWRLPLPHSGRFITRHLRGLHPFLRSGLLLPDPFCRFNSLRVSWFLVEHTLKEMERIFHLPALLAKVSDYNERIDVPGVKGQNILIQPYGVLSFPHLERRGRQVLQVTDVFWSEHDGPAQHLQRLLDIPLPEIEDAQSVMRPGVPVVDSHNLLEFPDGEVDVASLLIRKSLLEVFLGGIFVRDGHPVTFPISLRLGGRNEPPARSTGMKGIKCFDVSNGPEITWASPVGP